MGSETYRVKPGEKFKIKDWKTSDTGPFKDKEDAEGPIEKNLQRLRELQEVIYAEGKHAVLVVFQAMDAGGKDGAIEHVFSGVNPQGCQVTPFKGPTPIELAHDYLWRVHAAVPRKGMIGIFNRSHYEDVLVARVRKLVPKDVWSRRYEQIRSFEKMLSEEGTTIVKFFLHISKEEQKERQEDRLNDKSKNWKFDIGDLADRERWDEYMEAYEAAIGECSTETAPWYVVPADRKWFRNWVISQTLVKTLEALKPQYPKPPEGLDKIKVK